jgi:outer membrane protein assembly factor BamB
MCFTQPLFFLPAPLRLCASALTNNCSAAAHGLNLKIAVAIIALFCCAADWPQFRGPNGDGTADATNLPIHWGGFDPPTWQTEIPGRGWSSPIIVGDRIWLTTAEPTALPSQAREKKLEASIYRDYRDQLQVHSSVTCYAIEVAAASGEILRTIELFTCDDPPPIHATNGYASPTPASDGQRLVCHFGSLGTVGLDTKSGQLLWKQRFSFDEITGPGSSPAIDGQLVIIPCDGADAQFVVALNIETGETVWRTPRPPIDDPERIHRRAFSTPLIVGQTFLSANKIPRQAIIPGAQWLVSYDPFTGRELWRVNMGDCHAIIPRPVFHGGLVYVCTGYMKPQLWAVRVDGSGDVTHSHVAWKYDKQVPEISSPIVVGSEIYFVSSLGILTCLDAATGSQLWQHRLGGNFSASPIAADGKLYFTSREGQTTVLRPGQTYDELARNQLFGQTLASPAICGHALLIRADRILYCLGQPLP